MKQIGKHRSGFTLVEIILVLCIMAIMASIGTIPYTYYMDRARVEEAMNMVTQKWTLAHTDIRNGALFDEATGKNANMVVYFLSGSSRIDFYLLSGSTLPASFPIQEQIGVLRLLTSAIFPKNISILSLSGATLGSDGKSLGYYIEAPFGSGVFFNETSRTSSGVSVLIGYPGGTSSNYRAREIYLSPQNY